MNHLDPAQTLAAVLRSELPTGSVGVVGDGYGDEEETMPPDRYYTSDARHESLREWLDLVAMLPLAERTTEAFSGWPLEISADAQAMAERWALTARVVAAYDRIVARLTTCPSDRVNAWYTAFLLITNLMMRRVRTYSNLDTYLARPPRTDHYTLRRL